MKDSNMLSYRLEKLGKKLMAVVFIPLFTQNCQWIYVSEEKPSVLTFKFDKTKGCHSESLKTLSNLDRVFGFLHQNIGGETQSSKIFMMYLGKSIGAEFVDHVIKECIVPAIPESRDLLTEFDCVVNRVNSLQQYLHDISFLEEENNSLVSYVSDANTLFTNKRCQHVLAEARRIMKEDLHVTTVVEPLEPIKIDDLEPYLNIKLSNHDISEIPLPLADKEMLPFVFPRCEISKSCLKLETLARDTLEDAFSPNSTPFYTKRLLLTVRSMFQMYRDVLPIEHKSAISFLPQLSALAFNNCHYLAHQCLTLADCVNNKKPSSKRITFADLVFDLRQTGCEVMLKEMRNQRDQLRAILRDSTTGLGQLNGNNLLPPAAEKCVQQVAYQIKHLKKVWLAVLPPNIYLRIIGTLLNSVIEELIEKVLILEDIAADSAEQICNLYATVLKNGPQIFVLEDSNEKEGRIHIVSYVKLWHKFNELIIILNASLKEIEDRWSSGKGPLALTFKPEEVKRMIRALFQNTDRRAGVLSRIKHEN